MEVDFTDTSSGDPTSWSWDFGDGSSDTTRNPNHTYVAPGDYLVTMTSTNAGGSNSRSRLVTVVALAPPAADFTWQQTPASLEVDFTDTSSGDPTSWSWDFGDGSSDTTRNPNHTYVAPGD